MANWDFYGRKTELAKLRAHLELDTPADRRRFAAYYIAGRRGIGKIRLVKSHRQ